MGASPRDDEPDATRWCPSARPSHPNAVAFAVRTSSASPSGPRVGYLTQAVPVDVQLLELAEPAVDPAHLQLLLRERLARVELAAPTLELELRCSEVSAAPAPNGELFPTRASADEGIIHPECALLEANICPERHRSDRKAEEDARYDDDGQG